MTGWTSAAADRGESGKVSDRVHAALRTRILDGTYPAGKALPGERRLSDELGASRHAVREALKRLQQANLVAISQGGATRVKDWRRHGGLELLLAVAADGQAPPELRAVRAAMEMRACIGADAARLAATRADDAQRAQIVARAEALAQLDVLEARNAQYENLWDLVVDASDNVAYRLALTTLVGGQRVAAVDAIAVAAELRDEQAIRALARAIADGDAPEAERRARALLDRSIPREA